MFRLDGTPVASASEPTPTRILGPDSAEHDAEELWTAALGVLRRAVAALPDPRAVRGIAVASIGEAGVLLGADGAALAPIIAWYDTRTTAELEWLLTEVGFEALHRTTGLCADPTFTLAKLLWYRRQHPELLAAAQAWLNVGDYLAWRICGERATDVSLASRTMLLDLERRSWRKHSWMQRSCRATFFHGSNPTAVGSAPSRPRSPRRPVFPRLRGRRRCSRPCLRHDGRGCRCRWRPLDSLGTAEALTLVRDRPIDDPAIGWDGFDQGAFDAGHPLYYVFGGLPTAAASVEWVRGLHGGVDHATLIAEAEKAEGAADSVLFLPHLRLGSPPFPDPVGRGAFLGISSTTDRGVLFRAVLEGIALDGGNMLKAMLHHLGNGAPERIVTIGGSTRNRLLMALKASVFGQELEVVDLPDATCLGAALLGGLAAGLFRDLEEARRGLRLPARIIAPDPRWTDSYRLKRQTTYAAAYAALRPLHARLLDD